jgi:hypothetical protein
LASANPFWKLVRDWLREDLVHLLVIARDDARAMGSVRFLGDNSTTERPIFRVDKGFIGPILESVAPEDAKPPIVSNPQNGWTDLRDLVRRDVAKEGPVLMQQFRTVLLGLKSLTALTIRHYRRAGGLKGLEALALESAIDSAARKAGGGDSGRRRVRAILNALVVRGTRDQPAKAKSELLDKLVKLAGDEARARAVLASLEKEQIVHPTTIAGREAWKLDHDYLAHAVLSEAGYADRWATAVREGAKVNKQSSSVSGWWSTLLPLQVFPRVAWERVRGRLEFGRDRRYVMVSAVKPLSVVVILAALAVGVQQIVVTVKANEIVSQFGGSAGDMASLSDWRTSEAVRSRVYDLLRWEDGGLERALESSWPLAHARIEPRRVGEALRSLRVLMNNEALKNSHPEALGGSYKALTPRLDPSAAREQAEFWRREEIHFKNRIYYLDVSFVGIYASVTRMLDVADAKAEAKMLRNHLFSNDGAIDITYADLYLAVADKDVSDPVADVARIRSLIYASTGTDPNRDQWLARFYAVIAMRLPEAAAAQEAETLRTCIASLATELDSGPAISPIAEMYAAAAARLGPEAARKEAEALLQWLQNANSRTLGQMPDMYAAVATRLRPSDAATEADALWTQLKVALGNDSDRVTLMASLLSKVARHFDGDIANAAAAEMSQRLFKSPSDRRVAFVLAAMSARVNNQDVGKAVRIYHDLLQIPFTEVPDDFVTLYLSAYKDLCTRLTSADALEEVKRWRRETYSETDETLNISGPQVEAYRAAAARLDEDGAQEEANALRSTFFDPRNTEAVARCYAIVAAKLRDAELRDQAKSFWLTLQSETIPARAKGLAIAYAATAKALLVRSPDTRHEIVRQLLVIAGHPFLDDPTPVIDALEPLTDHKLDTISAAHDWAHDKYGLDDGDLRPLPPDDPTVRANALALPPRPNSFARWQKGYLN